MEVDELNIGSLKSKSAMMKWYLINFCSAGLSEKIASSELIFDVKSDNRARFIRLGHFIAERSVVTVHTSIQGKLV